VATQGGGEELAFFFGNTHAPDRLIEVVGFHGDQRVGSTLRTL
jgi:hypothetical protein